MLISWKPYDLNGKGTEGSTVNVIKKKYMK
jgi:hypothetical protein